MSPRISVVIPTYNEEGRLAALLGDIARACLAYRHGARAVEVVVADNGSSDDTVALARLHGCKVLYVRPRLVASVRNAGAREARGTLLAFVDADTRIDVETFNAIDDHFATGEHIVGTTGAFPERRSLPIVLGWRLAGLAGALIGLGIPRSLAECAPTGVVCCARGDWEAVGGYPEFLFAEDVAFILSLKQLGRRLGRSARRIRHVPAIVSTRRFDEHGDWHFVAMPAKLLMQAFRSGGLRAWAKRYWYGPQRTTNAG